MSDGSIPDQMITASSEFDHDCLARLGRLNGPAGTAWCSTRADSLGKAYLQVDLGIVKNITKIATQGRGHAQYPQWTKQFSLSYSNNGTVWTVYNGSRIACKWVRFSYGVQI